MLLGLVLLFSGLAFYLARFDRVLEADYTEAEQLMASGNYEEALAGFESIYRRHPSFRLAPQALFQSAEVLNLYLRRYQEALLAYLLVEKDFPENELAHKAQHQVAEIYKNRLRDYRQAILVYQKMLTTAGAEGDHIQYEVADCYFRLEEYPRARTEFETLVNRYPESELLPEVRYRIGVCLSLEGDLGRAAKVFREIGETWPGSGYALEARFSLASVLEEREELQAALQILESLRGHYPQADALERKLELLRRRISQKKRGI